MDNIPTITNYKKKAKKKKFLIIIIAMNKNNTIVMRITYEKEGGERDTVLNGM